MSYANRLRTLYITLHKKRKDNTMSKTDISPKVKAELWFRAAGRCEFKGCNKALYEHGITLDECNLSNCAHIIADSYNGPRGDKKLSEKLAKDINNIMLMCPECHRIIDIEGKEKYSVNTLRQMKKHHEDRMRYLTGLSEDLQANIVTFGGKIENHMHDFDFHQLQDALLPDYYPASSTDIDLGGSFFSGSNWETFWKTEEENLVYNCKDKVLDRIGKWEYKRIALFAIGPMPLLVKLGTMLNNKHEIEVYQKQRSGGWKWKYKNKTIKYIVNRPEDTSRTPVLVLSLSNSIVERVKSNRKDCSIWELTIENPNPDFLTSKKMLYDYSRTIERLLQEITRISNGTPLELYLSVPVACAVEFGRVWMPKANCSLKIYDFNTKYSKQDKIAIEIKNK